MEYELRAVKVLREKFSKELSTTRKGIEINKIEFDLLMLNNVIKHPSTIQLVRKWLVYKKIIREDAGEIVFIDLFELKKIKIEEEE